jgi:ABC-type transporter Mla maintaining outer membrane lipid asymmetry ATPase subunit MlaF
MLTTTETTVPETLKPIIEIQGVSKWYGSFHVLRQIDLRVQRGGAHRDLRPLGLGKIDDDTLHQPP